MALITSKWMLFPATLLIVLVVLYFLGNKSVRSEIVIPASPEQVWSVLMNIDDYPEWNGVMHLLEGRLKTGNQVKYRFFQDANSAYEIQSSVKEVVEQQLLNQGGGMPGVLTFDHRYILEPVATGTKVIIHEQYRGVAVPFWNPAPVEMAYQRLNQSLHDRVLTLHTEIPEGS